MDLQADGAGLSMRITKAITEIRVEYNGVLHKAHTDGDRTETKCGIVAKGVSGQTEVFKTVGTDGSIIVECAACYDAE